MRLALHHQVFTDQHHCRWWEESWGIILRRANPNHYMKTKAFDFKRLKLRFRWDAHRQYWLQFMWWEIGYFTESQWCRWDGWDDEDETDDQP